MPRFGGVSTALYIFALLHIVSTPWIVANCQAEERASPPALECSEKEQLRSDSADKILPKMAGLLRGTRGCSVS